MYDGSRIATKGLENMPNHVTRGFMMNGNDETGRYYESFGTQNEVPRLAFYSNSNFHGNFKLALAHGTALYLNFLIQWCITL